MKGPHRLLVTGGAGFIGSNFIRQQLLEKEPVEKIVCLDKLTYAGNLANLAEIKNPAASSGVFKVAAVDSTADRHPADGGYQLHAASGGEFNPERLKNNPAFVFVEGDISDAEKVASLLTQHQITGVVHFAAESHVDRSIDSPEIFLQTNVIGTLRLLDAVRRYWNGLDAAPKAAFRFVHVSTDEVFGSLGEKDPAFTEETAYAPNSPYAASKAGSDHLARAYFHTYGLPVVTGNCTNNYGPYQFPEKLIPLMVLNALEQKPLPVYGDGGQIRDWLYVADHARALRLVLEEGRPGEVYVIGGLNEIRNLDLVRQLCAALDELRPRANGLRYEELITFVTDRPGHDRRYAVNCQKIKQELGWQPRENFASGLRATIAWYLENREWCAEIAAKKYQRDRLGLSTAPKS